MRSRDCCLCLSSRTGVLLTGILSLAVCLAVLLPLVYTLVKEEVAEQIKKAGDSWLENTPLLSYDRDAQVQFFEPSRSRPVVGGTHFRSSSLDQCRS